MVPATPESSRDTLNPSPTSNPNPCSGVIWAQGHAPARLASKQRRGINQFAQALRLMAMADSVSPPEARALCDRLLTLRDRYRDILLTSAPPNRDGLLVRTDTSYEGSKKTPHQVIRRTYQRYRWLEIHRLSSECFGPLISKTRTLAKSLSPSLVSKGPLRIFTQQEGSFKGAQRVIRVKEAPELLDNMLQPIIDAAEVFEEIVASVYAWGLTEESHFITYTEKHEAQAVA